MARSMHLLGCNETWNVSISDLLNGLSCFVTYYLLKVYFNFKLTRNKNMNTLKKIITALIISTLGFSFSSNATPIDMWDWEVDSYFSEYLPGTVVASDDNHWWDDALGFPTEGAPSKLSWGNNNSSLTLGGDNGHFVGEDLASGDSVQTASLTHHNFIINGGALTETKLNTKLLLAPANTPLIDAIPPLVFDIVFKETPNAEVCSYEGDDINGETTHCQDDIFVIDQFGTDTGGGVIYNPFTNTFNQQFGIGMYTYNIALTVDKLAALPNDVCARVNGADNPGCIGITTHENQDNIFNVNMMITQVPEPSTILLLSLALFGIVVSARNKHV